jgi:hypothetical protein
MKYIIILMIAISLHSNEILISTVSKHAKTDKDYNEINYGIGYRYYVKSYWTMSAMLIKDSFERPMVTFTYGLDKEIMFGIKAGIEIGMTVKSVINYQTEKFRYRLLPMIAPRITKEFKNININILYIPEAKIGVTKSEQVTTLIIGIKI